MSDSTDLVTILRRDYCSTGCNPSHCLCSICEDAADEIELLRAAIKDAQMAEDPAVGMLILARAVVLDG